MATVLILAQNDRNMEIKQINTVSLTPEMIAQCDDFISFIDPQRLSRGIRHLFMFYLIHEQDRPPGQEALMEDLKYMFEFLDRMSSPLENLGARKTDTQPEPNPEALEG